LWKSSQQVIFLWNLNCALTPEDQDANRSDNVVSQPQAIGIHTVCGIRQALTQMFLGQLNTELVKKSEEISLATLKYSTSIAAFTQLWDISAQKHLRS
jgi:hypothetical protein